MPTETKKTRSSWLIGRLARPRGGLEGGLGAADGSAKPKPDRAQVRNPRVSWSLGGARVGGQPKGPEGALDRHGLTQDVDLENKKKNKKTETNAAVDVRVLFNT